MLKMTTLTTNTDWMTTEDKVLSMSDYQLQTEVPAMMRQQGFTEEEIRRALQIVVEFRNRHKMQVIE